ncbi:FecR domain-containing protein [Pedobacter faecalis]|uniref:FecR domain-containing protein n=1 Tax=Pedobacter faecalis TaxID=3041495 RepID=UPI00254AB42C|nr:FecR domain-containing protein [Pedobacter sp. ELA7]
MEDELLIKYLLNEAAEAERIAVEEWLAQSEANRSRFAAFEKIWTASKSLSASARPDADEAWIRFKSRATEGNSESRQVPFLKVRPSFAGTWIRVAAALVAVVGIWLVYSLLGPSGYTDVVAQADVRREKLPDGSVITLNKNSSLSYAADFADNRSVRLKEGDVFFEVAPDRARPFVIDVDKVSVLVVGTSFNVKHRGNETEVIVESGIVRVSRGQSQLELRRGEKVLISAASGELRKSASTDSLYNYYRSKQFVADNIPLGRLLDVLNEAYEAQIEISDEATAREQISITLRPDTPLEDNLRIVCETLGLKMERNGKQYLLSKLLE